MTTDFGVASAWMCDGRSSGVVVVKHLAHTYRPGGGRPWLKIRTRLTTEAMWTGARLARAPEAPVPSRRVLLTTAELAKELRLSVKTIQRYQRTGKLRPAMVTPGGQYRWDLNDVHEQMRALRKRPDED